MQTQLNIDLYKSFNTYTITQLQELISTAQTREEKVFYSKLLSLKMVLAQEKVIGEMKNCRC